jgi:hypothetical protein
MAAANFSAEDLAELCALCASAQRPRVSALLAALCSERETAAVAPSAAAAAPAPAVPLAAAPSAAAPAPAALAPSPATWTSLCSYGFEDIDGEVEVLVFDDALAGVGALARERADAVTCSFTDAGFDLRVLGLRGKSLRLLVTNLEHDVVPSACRLVIGKNRLTLRLRKAHSYDMFTNLVGKKPRASAKAAGADPAASVLDLMKDMYADGDDNTKRVIAEAFAKSREPRGADFGGGGGFGDGLE